MVQDENQLILKAQQGDTFAFEQLIYRYDKHVLGIAASFRNNEEDAKDIYQEVFMRAFRGIKNFRFQSEFSTWLYRIATNVCLTFSKQKKKYVHTSIDEEFEGEDSETFKLSDTIAGDSFSDSQTFNNELNESVLKAVETLSPKLKMVFTLKHIHDYKIKEIAVMMNCAEGTVKGYLFSATQKLRIQLKYLLD